jgi:hypothetical protein
MEKSDMSCKENMVPLKTIEPSKRRTIKLQTYFFLQRGIKDLLKKLGQWGTDRPHGIRRLPDLG